MKNDGACIAAAARALEAEGDEHISLDQCVAAALHAALPAHFAEGVRR